MLSFPYKKAMNFLKTFSLSPTYNIIASLTSEISLSEKMSPHGTRHKVRGVGSPVVVIIRKDGMEVNVFLRGF